MSRYFSVGIMILIIAAGTTFLFCFNVPNTMSVTWYVYYPSLLTAWLHRDYPHFTGEITEADGLNDLPEGLGIALSQLGNCSSSTPHRKGRRGTGQILIIKVLNLLTLCVCRPTFFPQ